MESAAISLDHVEPRWSLPARVSFRFVLALLVLFFFPGPLQFYLPADWISMISPKIVPWFAAHALHIGIPQIRYSPDTAAGNGVYANARSLLFLILASLSTVVWSLADRQHRDYTRLHNWLRFYLRATVGCLMIDYGTSKLFFPGQMRSPTISSLLVPFGDFSRMGVLWLFMGSSHLYTFASGAVEVFGGMLLFVPRLTTLGSLICAAALANVFLLDVSYDVTVKQLPLLTLLALMFLLAPEVRRLANVLILNRAVKAMPLRPLFERRWLERTVIILTMIFGFSYVAYNLVVTQPFSKTAAEIPVRTPYFGVWAVDEFTVGGVQRPPVYTDTIRRKLVIFDWEPFSSKPSMVVHFAPGTRRLFSMEFDQTRRSISLTRPDSDASIPPEVRVLQSPPRTIAHLDLKEQQGDRLLLDGDFEGQRVRAALHRVPTPAVPAWRFQWLRRGPRWGNDIIL